MPRQSGFADRDPCPWRIIDDVGGAFCMGAIGGGVWHTVKGARMAPAGARLAGSLAAVQARSPVLGGQFAVWGGLFACFDCTLTSIRQKEDPWNSIVSGAATGGVLAARAGPRAFASAAVVGGVLLALIEGMGIMITKMMAPPIPQTPEDYERLARQDVTAPPTAGGLFPSGGSFGGYGGGGSGAAILPPPAHATHSADTLDPFDTSTTFSTEGSSSSSSSYAENNEKSSSWWPFGGGSK